MSKDNHHLNLKAKLKFWYQEYVKGQNKFEDSLKPVAIIKTVQDFWAYYQHFKRPTELPLGSCIYLFKDNVKPVWEDQNNKNGGAFVLRFEKSKCNRLWEDVLLGFVSQNVEVYSHLNGIRIKIRKDFTEIDFWLNKIDDEKILEQYRRWIVEVASLQNDTPLEVIQFHVEE